MLVWGLTNPAQAPLVTQVTLHSLQSDSPRKRPRTASGHDIDLRKHIRIATWNVLTLNTPGTTSLLSRELKKYNISLAGLSETHWPLIGEQTIGGYTFLWSGPDCRSQGVALALNLKSQDALINWEPISFRLLKTRLHHGKLTVIVCYAPTNVASDADKDRFY